jgi:hypothetical protein
MKNWLPAVTLAFGGLFVAAAQGLAPGGSHRVAAIFPPWWSAKDCLVAAAGAGDILGFGALPFIVAVEADTTTTATTLHGAGAILVVDASPFLSCLTVN